MKKIFLFLFISSTFVLAQTAGESGMAFLKIGSSVRSLGTSDLGVAGISEISTASYNPAFLSKMNEAEIYASHSKWMEDVSTQNISAGARLFGIPFAIHLNKTSISEVEVRTRPGEAESTFDVNYFSAAISAGFSLSEYIDFGLALKYLFEGIYTDRASGFAADFGIKYTGIAENFEIGASLRNIGSMSELRNEATELPVDLRAGAAYNLHIDEFESVLKILGGIQTYTASGDIHFHAGTEFNFNKYFFVRGGFVSGYDSKNISLGLGLNWNGIGFDYAFVPYDYGLGNTNTVSLAYKF